ncbi:unnamed protein product, partial [marine sediment metagenome]
MANRTDDKGTVISAVGTEVEYLQSLGATSDQVNEAWYEVFVAGGAFTCVPHDVTLSCVPSDVADGKNVRLSSSP